MKIRTCRGQIFLSKIDEICSWAIPNQVSTISMHTPSLVKIRWYLLKLSSGNENTDVSRADNSVKNWRNLPINNPKPDLHNINAHTQFNEIYWHLLKLSSGNENMDGRTGDRRTDARKANLIPYYPATIVWRGIKI